MDWSEIIEALIDSGMTQVQIAHACRITQPAISDLANGHTKEPLGGTAIKLLELREALNKGGPRKNISKRRLTA